eukprot:1194088-Prorocentrum_minimum.AAC.1
MQQQLHPAAPFHDVCFVVEEQRVPAHRCILSARSAYFRAMLSDGFRESDSPEIHIQGTSCAAFKALLAYLYTDRMEVDEDKVLLFDLAKLCDQYQEERLYNHCMWQLMKGITHQNAVTRLIEAHACEGGGMWTKLQSATMAYVTRNLRAIWRKAKPTLAHLDTNRPDLYKKVVLDAALRR